MWKHAKWLGIPRQEIEEKKIVHGDLGGRFAYCRCETTLPAASTLTLDITANSRYRLWINARPVLSGPCKGDRNRQYYETVDVSDYLREGKNVFCAQVLYNDPDVVERQIDERAAIYGVVGRQCGHRLAIEGDAKNAAGETVGTVTTGLADWRVWLDNSFFLKSNEITQFLGAVIEELDAAGTPIHWKEADFDAGHWHRAEALSSLGGEDPMLVVGVQPLFRVVQREIPLLYERERRFADSPEEQTVRAGETAEFLFDAGVILNAYPRFSFEGGKGARVRITYFEKFGGPGWDGDRADRRGEISGITDTLLLDGSTLCYEPFWVRTFRFLRLRIEAGNEAVTVFAPRYRKTGYPLPVQSQLSSSAPWVEKLWDISLRTLENCMLETYMDCPYYEQLQYGMDTRLEAQYTYAVSSDTALVRKALHDFHYGMQPEGLMSGKAPSAYLQILSTFSLHYIIMLWEYAERKDDPALIRLCRGDVDRVLDYYDSRIGADGLVGRLDFWEFVDWQDAWNATAGTPAALLHGPSTIINLMYAYALDCASKLMAKTGRPALAEEYRARREAILAAIEKRCWDETAGLYREGPDVPQFSRHAQAWAVLNGMKEGTQAETLLRTAMDKDDCLVCSFSTSFEWFRALEKAGMFAEMRRELQPWIGLLDLNCTCCPETPTNARSDCHAWSALPLYELMRSIAGVKLLEDDTVRIAPHMMDLPDLSGQAATDKGPVRFDYRKEDGVWTYRIELPEGLSGRFIHPDGREAALCTGSNLF